MKGILDRGLSETAEMWPRVEAEFAVLHEAAQILANKEGHDADGVRERYASFVQRLEGQTQDPQAGALRHFLKVTQSYWPGLFHCYDVAGLPRTNNDLEQHFGRFRCQERRCTGRKVASPSLVQRGSVRLWASTMTQNSPLAGADLAPRQIEDWRALRRTLEARHGAAVDRCRFRRNPQGYLREIEEIVQAILPP